MIGSFDLRRLNGPPQRRPFFCVPSQSEVLSSSSHTTIDIDVMCRISTGSNCLHGIGDFCVCRIEDSPGVLSEARKPAGSNITVAVCTPLRTVCSRRAVFLTISAPEIFEQRKIVSCYGRYIRPVHGGRERSDMASDGYGDDDVGCRSH